MKASSSRYVDPSSNRRCHLTDSCNLHKAFCRLLRIGQKNEVEVVKLIVPQTIDDYMRNLQNHKTREIDATMGENALAGRDGMRQLFNMFAEVTECESGAILVRTKKR